MTVVNKAIAEHSGAIDFYINEQSSVWGTADKDWMLRNQQLGKESHASLSALRNGYILNEYGVPYYMKVDIEGLDYVCISSLVGKLDKPKYVSVETHAWSYHEYA